MEIILPSTATMKIKVPIFIRAFSITKFIAEKVGLKSWDGYRLVT